MEWIKVTKENKGSLKADEKIRFHNTYEVVERTLTDFWLERGYIATGVHNETIRFVGDWKGEVHVLREV